jgi:3-oxoacyl-[acyl-carrier protein] reductase
VREIDKAGGQGSAQQMDVTEHGSVEAAVYRAIEFAGGALDIVINNAGVFEIRPFDKMDTALWLRHVHANLDGPFFVTLEALDALYESPKAHIFNIASQAARQPFPGNTAYCATKYGCADSATRCAWISRPRRCACRPCTRARPTPRSSTTSPAIGIARR